MGKHRDNRDGPAFTKPASPRLRYRLAVLEAALRRLMELRREAVKALFAQLAVHYSQIQENLAALRILDLDLDLDLEGPSVLGPEAAVAYCRRLPQRVAELDKRGRNPAP